MILQKTSAIFFRRMLCIACTLFFSHYSFTQDTSVKDSLSRIENGNAEKIFEKVEIEASFPGGDNAWIRFLEQNLNGNVPTIKGAPTGAYTVIIQFVVDRDGKVSDIKALTSHGYGMEAEVIRLLRKAPRWNPAFQDGRNVRAYRKQPVTFMVVDEEKKKKKNKG